MRFVDKDAMCPGIDRGHAFIAVHAQRFFRLSLGHRVHEAWISEKPTSHRNKLPPRGSPRDLA
jgi:hypothetical protein